jgi:hypothetical protein
MNKNVIYVGIDVDDNSFHVSAFFKDSGELEAVNNNCRFFLDISSNY